MDSDERSGVSDTAIPLPRLYERDIDVLLHEELLFNKHVRQLVAKALNLRGMLEVTSCHLSVLDQTGETDVHANFSCNGSDGALLIENKIDADFQPRRPERYRERAQLLCSRGKSVVAFCVLVAPAEYIRAKSAALRHFDVAVSYEDLALAVRKEETPRAEHRAALIERAVEQARSAYTMVPDAAVGTLWQRIYAIARSEYAELQMNAPLDKGSNSSWVIFKAGLPPKVTIDWKIGKGTVELSFWKGAPGPNAKFSLAALPAGASREQLGETTAIRLPSRRPIGDWSQISDAEIEAALDQAETLLKFYRANPAMFG